MDANYRALILNHKTMNRLLILSFFSIVFASCEFNATTANIQNSKVCSDVMFESGKGCLEDRNVFEEFPNQVINTLELQNAPKGTEVRLYWFQLIDDKYALIDSVSYISTETTELLTSTFDGNNLPVGKYKVVSRVIADNKEPVEKLFEIQFPTMPSANMSFIGRSVYEDMRVKDLTKVFNDSDSTVYFSTSLYNIPHNTDVHIHFEDENGAQKSFSLNTQTISDKKININSNIKRSALGKGECKVKVQFLDFQYVYPFVIQ